MSATSARPTTITSGPAADPHASELLQSAADISRELRSTAVDREAADQPPHAEIALLRDAGLLAAREPAEFGGPGLSWGQVLRLVREIAAGDTSIGQLLSYHHVNLFGVHLGSSPEQLRELSEGTVREGWFWGDIANPLDPPVVLTPDGDGYRANGTKTFATGASVADKVVVFGAIGEEPRLFLVSQGQAGLSFDRGAFDFIGVRLSDSGSGTLSDVRVDAGDLFGPPPGSVPADAPLPPSVSLFIVAQQSSLSAFYLGAARGALIDAADYVRTTTRPWLHSGLDRAADDPSIVERFGQLDARLRGAEALLERAAEQIQAGIDRGDELTARERGEIAATTYASKVLATEVALEVTAKVFEVQGARSAHRRYGLDRRWRDVRTHSLHDPVFYKARDVGDFVLNDRVPEPDGNRYR